MAILKAEFSVFCKCGAGLGAKLNGSVITVRPCNTCLGDVVEDAEEVGRDEGHAEGYDEGRAVGYDEGLAVGLEGG